MLAETVEMTEEELYGLSTISPKKYGGKLDHWSEHKVYDGIIYVFGYMRGYDPTHRFVEKQMVRTSSVKRYIRCGAYLYAETANTFYALLTQAPPGAVGDEFIQEYFE